MIQYWQFKNLLIINGILVVSQALPAGLVGIGIMWTHFPGGSGQEFLHSLHRKRFACCLLVENAPKYRFKQDCVMVDVGVTGGLPHGSTEHHKSSNISNRYLFLLESVV